MVCTIRQISSSSNSGKYFYFTERNFESSSGWHDSKGKSFLDLLCLDRGNLEVVLDGELPEKVEIEGEAAVVTRVLGKKTKEGIEHNPGRELILSAPKSVSIMGLVAGDARVVDAHEAAVSAVLDYYERNMVYARVQQNKVPMSEKSDNIVVAKFTHICSRPNKVEGEMKAQEVDPQLHTHCLIANAMRCLDGVWRSIVFDKLYDNKMHLGELYRMELAHNLTSIGYGIDLKKDKSNHWTFEIAGVPEQDIQEFSKRREKIIDVASELNIEKTQENLALIAKATREEKVKCSRDTLQSNWEGRVFSIFLLNNLKKECDGKKAQINKKELREAFQSGLKHLSEKEAVFSKEEIITSVLSCCGSRFSIKEIEKELLELVAEGKLIAEYDNKKNSFTTPESLRLEKDVIGLMQGFQGSIKPIMSTHEVEKHKKGLTVGQVDAAHLILSTSDRVVGIQGTAGTGKTTVLRTVKEWLAEKNFELIGLAPTKSAANTMRKEAGIEAMTGHLFLAKYAGVLAGRGTNSGREKMRTEFSNKVVVLDEAGLASSEQIKGLLTLAKELKFRFVMLGDVKQLGAVEAGKPFHYLQNHGMNTAQMSNIKRQKNKELRDSIYSAEAAVDKVRYEASRLIKKIGKNNIIDVSKSLKKGEASVINQHI